jgi:hypothetical protein
MKTRRFVTASAAAPVATSPVSEMDALLTPACKALGVYQPSELAVALRAKTWPNSYEKVAARALYNARVAGDIEAARIAVAGALKIAEGEML